MISISTGLSLRSAAAMFAAFMLSAIFLADAHAVPVNYGDVEGATVWFRDIEEDSATDPTPLFGAPSVGGDTLDFNPIDFEADSQNGSPQDDTTGTLTMMIEAKPNRVISQVTVNERGDYTIAGFGGINTAVVVTADITITITEINNLPVAPIPIVTTMDMTPSDGDYDLFNDGIATNAVWSGMKMIDVSAVASNVTKVTFEVSNMLSAKSETNSTALIAKKDFGGTSITVPEPSTASLAVLALSASILSRRRRA